MCIIVKFSCWLSSKHYLPLEYYVHIWQASTYLGQDKMTTILQMTFLIQFMKIYGFFLLLFKFH